MNNKQNFQSVLKKQQYLTKYYFAIKKQKVLWSLKSLFSILSNSSDFLQIIEKTSFSTE